jgi:hypothetical protein
VKEAVTEGFFIRHCVVGNDWVLVKENNTLYRRYIPGRGVGPIRILHGNKALLAAVPAPQAPTFLTKFLKGPFDGKIVRWNKNIQVFSDYTKALAACPTAKISPESVKFVPAKREPPAWWLKRRLEPETVGNF